MAPFEPSESIVALLGAEDGRFLELNAAFEKLTGYSRAAAGEKPGDFHGFQKDSESVGDFIRL